LKSNKKSEKNLYSLLLAGSKKIDECKKFNVDEISLYHEDKKLSRGTVVANLFRSYFKNVKQEFIYYVTGNNKLCHTNRYSNNLNEDILILEKLIFHENWMRKDLKELFGGLISIEDFKKSFKIKTKMIINDSFDVIHEHPEFGNKPLVGFYDKDHNFFPITNTIVHIEYWEIPKDQRNRLPREEWCDYLVKNEIVIAQLTFKELSGKEMLVDDLGPFIYVPMEQKWYSFYYIGFLNDKYKIETQNVNYLYKYNL
jgi:hypothetical protein